MNIVSIEAQNKYMKQLLKQLSELQDPTMMSGEDMDKFRELQNESEKFLEQFK